MNDYILFLLFTEHDCQKGMGGSTIYKLLKLYTFNRMRSEYLQQEFEMREQPQRKLGRGFINRWNDYFT